MLELNAITVLNGEQPVPFDHPCRVCGYSLRGRRAHELCPECALPAIESFRDSIWFASLAQLRRLRFSTKMLFWTVPLVSVSGGIAMFAVFAVRRDPIVSVLAAIFIVTHFAFLVTVLVAARTRVLGVEEKKLEAANHLLIGESVASGLMTMIGLALGVLKFFSLDSAASNGLSIFAFGLAIIAALLIWNTLSLWISVLAEYLAIPRLASRAITSAYVGPLLIVVLCVAGLGLLISGAMLALLLWKLHRVLDSAVLARTQAM